MPDGNYAAPESLEAAVALLAEAPGDVNIMAGGTDVLVQLHSELIDPDLIVDVKNIPELREISVNEGRFLVGAAVSGMEIMRHEAFAATWPGVVEGVALIGSVQVKGRASMGGNLCNASPAADSVPPLIAAGAIAHIAGPSGNRQAPVESIVTGPGETSLAKSEIIVTFEFPTRPTRSGDCYMRLTPRTEMDIAVVGAGVNLTLDTAGTCIAARLALGAVAPTPVLASEAASALIGTTVDEVALTNMADAVRQACDPIDDKRGTKKYRIKTAAVIARRVAEKAAARARGQS